jgi:hypothetical protein
MAKKKSTGDSPTKNIFERPVHGLIGYTTLLLLAIVVLVLVYSLQWYIVP